MPTISVVMCIYNEKINWIRESIESIVNQSYSDFEYIIVVDNPDLSEEIHNYLTYISEVDKRIKLVYNKKNLGLADSLNAGIKQASGEYIARMDADDIAKADRFEKELNYLKVNNADVVSCQRIYINEDGEEIGKSALSVRPAEKRLKVSNCICHPAAIIKRKCLTELGGYRKFKKSQDYDLWLRFMTEGKKLVILDEYLLLYRIRANSISTTNKLEQYYISEYQKKLYKERLKYGKDSFSEDDLMNYLESKKMTESKIKRYNAARKITNIAIDKLRKNDMTLIIDVFHAFFVFPEVPIKTIIAYFKLR